MTSAIDGRTMRRQRNTDRMLHAGLMLVQRGQWRPKPEEIAAESNVSVRTFFAAFRTIEHYYEALLARHPSELRACLPADGDNAVVRLALTGKTGP